MPASPPQFNRRPWPMKWVVVAIVACLIPYTWLTLAYRKEGPAYEPYQDNKDRAQVLRLLDSGFRRVDLTLAPGDPSSATSLAATQSVPGGLPPLLVDALIDPAPLPDRFPRVDAPATAPADAPYPVVFTATPFEPTSATLYLRGVEAVFILDQATLATESPAHDPTAPLHLSVPPHTFAPGTYHATLAGAAASRRWTFEIH